MGHAVLDSLGEFLMYRKLMHESVGGHLFKISTLVEYMCGVLYPTQRIRPTSRKQCIYMTNLKSTKRQSNSPGQDTRLVPPPLFQAHMKDGYVHIGPIQVWCTKCRISNSPSSTPKIALAELGVSPASWLLTES